MTTPEAPEQPADAGPLSSNLLGSDPRRCKLTECRGLPRCSMCLKMDAAYGPAQQPLAWYSSEIGAVSSAGGYGYDVPLYDVRELRAEMKRQAEAMLAASAAMRDALRRLREWGGMPKGRVNEAKDRR